METVCITIDTDWASDWAMADMADILEAHEVKATWFLTHSSPVIDRLRAREDLFELGLHPNFFPNSTHGSRVEDVFQHCLDLVPGAKSMRTHGLYHYTNLLRLAADEYGIECDASVFLHRQRHVEPHTVPWASQPVCRIAYNWEDDAEMFEHQPMWVVEECHGYQNIVADFHPVHVAMNVSEFSQYERLREQRPLAEWDEGFIRDHRREGEGSRSMFMSLVARARDFGGGLRVADLAERSRGKLA